MKDKTYEYEYEVISTLVIFPQKIIDCNLEPKHFREKKFASLYGILVDEYKTHGMLDYIRIESKVKNFMNFVVECTNKVVTSANVEYFIEKVQEQYQLREYQRVIDMANSDNIEFEDVKSLMSKINDEFYIKSEKNKPSEEEVFEMITSKDELLEFTNFKLLPEKVHYIKNAVHIISARPSVGKSSLALNLFLDLSNKYNCIYLNMEMNKKDPFKRMVGIESGVYLDDFTKLTKEQEHKVKSSIKKMNKKNYQIIDGSKSVKSIRSLVSRESRNGHLILFVDYIGYVTNGKNQNDRERIGEAVREIQLMTKDYDLTVFMLAQINRDGADSPSINDLKDSGELEQSAETVLLLHNPCVDLNEQSPIYNIFIPKNRGGKQGTMNMQFNKNTQRFLELENDRVY